MKNQKRINRREFLGKSAAALATVPFAMRFSSAAAAKPNILFISADDLNDWIEPLKGYPGVLTPNLNRLAAKARLFKNAHTPAPQCSPARSAIMFGVYPHRSGIYNNDNLWHQSDYLQTLQSIPKFFKSNGYNTFGTGKLFHGDYFTLNPDIDPTAWTDFEPCQAAPDCTAALAATGTLGSEVQVPYGESSFSVSQMPDFIRAKWMAEQVLKKSHSKPFFAGIGIFKPHTPLAVPKRFFDLYPLANIRYPVGVLDRPNTMFTNNQDTQDLQSSAQALIAAKSKHKEIVDSGQWKPIVQAYLASISFADHCLGVILDGLENGPNAGNTIIVFFSDHGWQLGEKLAWHKGTLWERATRVPMMFAGPGISAGSSKAAVSSLSIYPTLTDLALGAVPNHLQGASLKNHLLHQAMGPRFALTAWQMIGTPAGNNIVHFSVRSANYRYIQYANGEKELYDHRTDPYEWENLYKPGSAKARDVASVLANYVPDASTWKPKPVVTAAASARTVEED